MEVRGGRNVGLGWGGIWWMFFFFFFFFGCVLFWLVCHLFSVCFFLVWGGVGGVLFFLLLVGVFCLWMQMMELVLGACFDKARLLGQRNSSFDALCLGFAWECGLPFGLFVQHGCGSKISGTPKNTIGQRKNKSKTCGPRLGWHFFDPLHHLEVLNCKSFEEVAICIL